MANTDLFLKVGVPGTATTLTAPGHAVAGTSINVVSTTNWPTTTGAPFAMDQIELVDGEWERVAGTYTEWVGDVSSATSITNMTLTYGTDQTYPAGSTTRVYIPVTSTRENRIIDGLLVGHTQLGAHKFTQVVDSNGNETLKLGTTASAVNEVTLTNKGTGVAPTVAATGDDTNIGLNLVSKGTGEVQLNGTNISGAWTTWTPTITNVSGGTLNYSKYKQIGKTVHFRLKYTLAGAGVTGGIVFTTPTSINSDLTSTITDIINGSVLFHDNAGVWYPGTLNWNSSTTLAVYAIDTGTAYGRLSTPSSTIPFTWGANDVFVISGTYEAA